MLHGLRPGQLVFCTSVDSIEESIPNKPKLHEFYKVRANLMGRGILLEEIVNEPSDPEIGEVGFPQSIFSKMDERTIRKMMCYTRAANPGKDKPEDTTP